MAQCISIFTNFAKLALPNWCGVLFSSYSRSRNLTRYFCLVSLGFYLCEGNRSFSITVLSAMTPNEKSFRLVTSAIICTDLDKKSSIFQRNCLAATNYVVIAVLSVFAPHEPNDLFFQMCSFMGILCICPRSFSTQFWTNITAVDTGQCTGFHNSL